MDFTVAGLNTTQVLQTNTKMNITATTGVLPNMNTSRVFKHELVFHSWQLQDVKMQDPGLLLGYDNSTGNFTVEATKAVATWVWLWLLPRDGTRDVGVKVKSDQSSGTSVKK